MEEAARRLGVAPDDVEQMIQQGRLASFRLGGHLLRVRLGDVERRVATPKRAGSGRLWDRVLDFFYFNGFYLAALLILLTLLAVILTL